MDAKISKRTISSSSMGKLSNRTLRALAIAIVLKNNLVFQDCFGYFMKYQFLSMVQMLF